MALAYDAAVGAVSGQAEPTKRARWSSSSRWRRMLSGLALVAIVALTQLLLHDAKLHLSIHSPHLRPSSSSSSSSSSSILTFPLHPRLSFFPFSSLSRPSVPAHEHYPAAASCRNPAAFPTYQPTSVTLTNMALADDTKSVVQQFEFTDEDVNRHVQEFLRQMDTGLAQDNTSLSQIPTYVTAVPNGTEKGLYLAVDLGGTNFRVCSIMLNGDTTFNLTYNKVAIPKELMTAKTSEELFSFLAKQIELFLREHHAEHFNAHIHRRNTVSDSRGFKEEEIFRLGFTFSFPVRQLGINKGLLMRWTKGFDIPDAVGKDVCALLQKEIDRLHLPVKVAALVNDTVGTLMARSYTSSGKHRSILGAIFGTGTNGAYIEKTANIKKEVAGDYDTSTGEMVINTEWGSFDNQGNVLHSTPWDKQLDRDSVNPGFQMFEKCVSGMFLGEIVRLAIVDMMSRENSTLFRDTNSSENDWSTTTNVAPQSGLNRQWGLDSALMSVAASDNTPELSTLRQELENALHIYTPSLEDAQAFKSVAAAVGRRAARLSAVAIGAVVLQSGKLDDPEEEVIDVGVDGSLVEHYPFFRDMIHEALRAIKQIGPKGADKIRIGVAKDGSGVGAALIALVAAQREQPGDFMKDLRQDIKRQLDQMPGPLPSAEESKTAVSNHLWTIGGLVGIAAIAAVWWNRQR